jgi:hypothetical protein
MKQILKRLLIALAVSGVLLGASLVVQAIEPVTLENLVAPESNRADEPLADKFSLEKAAHFLDSVSLEWQRSWQCFTCHTKASAPAVMRAASFSASRRQF